MKLLYLASLVYLVSICSSASIETTKTVSLVSLIGSHEDYVSKNIITFGYLERVGTLLCLFIGEKDSNYKISINSVLLRTEGPASIELESFKGSYVMIRGKFNTERSGVFSGEISNILQCREILPEGKNGREKLGPRLAIDNPNAEGLSTWELTMFQDPHYDWEEAERRLRSKE